MTIDLNQKNKFFKKGRIYTFGPNQGGTGILCEDINVAAALMCHAIKYVDRKVLKEYQPGKFAGTALGFVKNSGQKIFLFDIRGDVRELSERRRLFHAGVHVSIDVEFKENREFLLDALKVAERVAETGQKSYAMKGPGNGNEEAEVQGAESLPADGGSADAGADSGAVPAPQGDAGCAEEEAVGGGR